MPIIPTEDKKRLAESLNFSQNDVLSPLKLIKTMPMYSRLFAYVIIILFFILFFLKPLFFIAEYNRAVSMSPYHEVCIDCWPLKVTPAKHTIKYYADYLEGRDIQDAYLCKDHYLVSPHFRHQTALIYKSVIGTIFIYDMFIVLMFIFPYFYFISLVKRQEFFAATVLQIISILLFSTIGIKLFF